MNPNMNKNMSVNMNKNIEHENENESFWGKKTDIGCQTAPSLG
jgi:hypothetical protein